MNKHRDHRDARSRRGDFASSSDSAEEPRYFQHLDRVTGPSAEAEVIWFNTEKGFGFVKVADGTEAYLNASTLGTIGPNDLHPGVGLKVFLERGQKGYQVSRVLEILGGATGATVDVSLTHEARLFAADKQKELRAMVKWYNPGKGFGFVSPEDGGKDIFVHATALTRCGLTALTEGQAVLVTWGPGQKGPEIRTIRIG